MFASAFFTVHKIEEFALFSVVFALALILYFAVNYPANVAFLMLFVDLVDLKLQLDPRLDVLKCFINELI